MSEKNQRDSEIAEKKIEEKLRILFELQRVDSKMDEIESLKGDMPLLVIDLEDELAGLQTRMHKLEEEIATMKKEIHGHQSNITLAKERIGQFSGKLDNIKNNREYDSITKEIEYQKLEIELSEKKINQFNQAMEEKRLTIEQSTKLIEEKKSELIIKRTELENIIQETQKDESDLKQKSDNLLQLLEPRLQQAYVRIRTNIRNGLAVVSIEREACGGCHNRIPPQRQLEIASRKKIIVCEYCGRILVDQKIGRE